MKLQGLCQLSFAARITRAIVVTGCALSIGFTAGCDNRESSPVPDDSSAPATTLPVAPWSNSRLMRTDVPAVYYDVWRVAANRATCSLVALTEVGDGAAAVSRAATYSGGWAVAYDLPQLRSAFGIAGSGSLASDSTYGGWSNHLRWSDGSRADYGPEGGSGPTQLAYLRIANEGCLYNVWSRLGVEHLELLLDGIRRVEVGDAK